MIPLKCLIHLLYKFSVVASAGFLSEVGFSVFDTFQSFSSNKCFVNWPLHSRVQCESCFCLILVGYVSASQRYLGLCPAPGFCSVSSFTYMSIRVLYSCVLLIEISLNLNPPQSLIL